MTPMTKRVLVQQRVTGQDEYGAPVDAWENLIPLSDGKVWASVNDVSAREYIAAAATQNEVTTKIHIRRMTGILPSMRVVDGLDIYSIEGILRQSDTSMLLMCSRSA